MIPSGTYPNPEQIAMTTAQIAGNDPQDHLVQTATTSAPAWLAVAALALSTFASVTTEFLPVGLLTNIADGLHVTEGSAGLMITIPGLIAAVTGPLLIILAGRLDRRLVLLMLSVLLVISNVVAAAAPNLATMLVARVLLGVCVGGFWTFAPGATTHLVPEALQPRAMSYILAGISVATIAGVPAGAMLGNLAGWRVAFATSAGVSLIALALQFFTMPSMPAAHAIRFRELSLTLKIPMARLGLVVTFLLVAGHFATYTYIKPLLQQVFNIPSEGVTSLLLLYGIAGFIGTYFGGRLVAKSIRGTAFVAAAMIGSVLLLSTLGATGRIEGAAVALVWGVAFGLVPMSLTTWMLKALPDAAEAGQAVLVSVFQVAISLGAFVGGLVLDTYNIFTVTLLGCALVASAALTVAIARIK